MGFFDDFFSQAKQVANQAKNTAGSFVHNVQQHPVQSLYNATFKAPVDTIRQMPNQAHLGGNALVNLIQSFTTNDQNLKQQKLMNAYQSLDKSWLKQPLETATQGMIKDGKIDPNWHGNTSNYETAAKQAGGVGLEKVLNVASLLPAGKVAKEAVVGDSALQAAKTGAKQVGAYSAAQGSAQEAQKKDSSLGSILGSGVVSGAAGAGIGALTAGTVHAGVAGVNNLVSHVLTNASRDFKVNYLMNNLANLPKDEVKPAGDAKVPGLQATPKASPTAMPETLKSQFDTHAQDFVNHLAKGDTEAAQQVMARVANMQADDTAKQTIMARMQTMLEARQQVIEQHTQLPSGSTSQLEHAVNEHPAATPNEVAGLRNVAKQSGMNDQQYGNLLDARLKDMNENPHNQPPQPTAEQPTEQNSSSQVNGADAPLKNVIQQRGEQIIAKSKQNAEERYGASRPNPNEQATADRNAAAIEAEMQQPGKGGGTEPPVSDTPKPNVVKNDTQKDPYVGSSAHENVGGADGTGRPTPQAQASEAFKQGHDSAPAPAKSLPEPKVTPKPTGESTPPTYHAIANRSKEQTDGYVHAIHNGDTGETYKLKTDGSALSELHNRFFKEKTNAFASSSGRDITKVHGDAKTGHVAANEAILQHALSQLDNKMTKEDWQNLPHYLEGTLKDNQVSATLRNNKEMFQNLDRLTYMVHKENSPGMSELEGIGHTRHIYEGKQSDLNKRGLFGGRWSTKAGTQSGRTVAKFTDINGKSKVGTAEHLNLQHEGGRVYTDTNGRTYHATTATLRDKLDAGLKYSEDGRKMFETQMREALRVHNTSSTVRELTGNKMFSKDIVHIGRDEVPPNGYQRLSISGMQNYAVSKKVAGHLATIADHNPSLVSKVVSTVLKPSDAINHLSVRAFFTDNPFGHLPNVITQGLEAAGLHGPKGTLNVGKSLKAANNDISKVSGDFVKYLDAGGSLGMHVDAPKGEPKSFIAGAYRKAASVVGAPLKVGAAVNNRVDTVAKYANVKELVATGMSWSKAVQHVDKVVGDYGNLNKFEKNVMTRAIFFYPFAKIRATSLVTTGKGLFTNPKMYAGVALNGALAYGAYSAINAGLQNVTGNKFASVTKGGNLGLIDQLLKAKGQIEKGHIPSVISSRVPPAQKAIIEGIAKKGILSDNKPFNDQTAHALKTVFTQVADQQNASGKETPAEIALNHMGIYLSHGAKSAAAPNFTGTALGFINKDGAYSSKRAAEVQKAATTFKDDGGNKLLLYQAMRAAGDNSMQGFFSKNPQLDPKSDQFQGYNFRQTQQESKGVQAGMQATKEQGGSSLAYMQAQKAGGSGYYDKFFKEHPNLDPTSNQFQGYKNGKAASAKTSAKYASSKAKSEISNLTSKSKSRVKGMAKEHVKATAAKVTAPKIGITKGKKLSTKVAGVKSGGLKLSSIGASKQTKASHIVKAKNPSLKKLFN